MKLLTEVLGRSANEKPFILFPVGYPAERCRVPDLTCKPLSERFQPGVGRVEVRERGA
jgi:hypothetical protein